MELTLTSFDWSPKYFNISVDRIQSLYAICFQINGDDIIFSIYLLSPPVKLVSGVKNIVYDFNHVYILNIAFDMVMTRCVLFLFDKGSTNGHWS